MGRASTPTLLPLDSYARIMGIDPRHFNGVVTPVWPASSSCAAIWYQYAWQNVDAASREDLAEAIHQAEADIMEHLGYPLIPSWIEEERQRWTFTEPREHRFRSYMGFTPRLIRKAVRAQWGKIISGGIRNTADIEVPTTVPPQTWTWSDADGDGEEDTLTIGAIDFATPGVTDPAEVRVYFAGHSADERYRIRPIVVDISAQTIVISRWLLIDPQVWEGQQGEIAIDAAQAADASLDPNLVTSVDIYRVYNDPSQQVEFQWEPLPDEECEYACGYWFQSGCLGLRDHRRGLIVPYPGTWQESEEAFTVDIFAMDREPDRVQLWYRCGEALDGYLEMERQWQRAVAYYATALLQREICGCEALERHVGHWRKPPSLEDENWPDDALTNPFGPQRGALFAWRQMQKHKLGRGISM